MGFGAINDGCVLVRGKLTLLGFGVIPLEAEVVDVVIHGRATDTLDVVLSDIYASIQITLTVSVIS